MLPTHTCSCGARYLTAAWLALPLAGRTQPVDDEVLELRTCPCGSTRAIVIVPETRS